MELLRCGGFWVGGCSRVAGTSQQTPARIPAGCWILDKLAIYSMSKKLVTAPSVESAVTTLLQQAQSALAPLQNRHK